MSWSAKTWECECKKEGKGGKCKKGGKEVFNIFFNIGEQQFQLTHGTRHIIHTEICKQKTV